LTGIHDESAERAGVDVNVGSKGLIACSLGVASTG
jgi:hypothetical protein